MSLIDRLEDLHTWVWPATIGVVTLLLLMTRYVPVAQRARLLREIQIEQIMQEERVAPFIRTEQLWRDRAECATLRGDAELADYYDKCAEEARVLYAD